jgi:hypothetical protein
MRHAPTGLRQQGLRPAAGERQGGERGALPDEEVVRGPLVLGRGQQPVADETEPRGARAEGSCTWELTGTPADGSGTALKATGSVELTTSAKTAAR